jgi:hypothetical protein
MSNIKKIPVTIGFDDTKIVGILEIDTDELPKGSPDFIFSLGYEVLGVDDYNKVNDYNLVQLGIVNDRTMLEYLKDKYGN